VIIVCAFADFDDHRAQAVGHGVGDSKLENPKSHASGMGSECFGKTRRCYRRRSGRRRSRFAPRLQAFGATAPRPRRCSQRPRTSRPLAATPPAKRAATFEPRAARARSSPMGACFVAGRTD
jgi:hypothetical protein